ncbi:MAG TPA: hypothetical protein VGG69_09785 [Rhizomicrobium sp.]|jgi:hypothetical protein
MKLVHLSLIALCGLAACAAPQRQASLPPAPPGGEPGNIAGMDSGRIRVAFGAPQFVRKDGQAEMWRYDGASCKAFFFLYPNGSSMSVRHVETLPHPANQAADSTCLQDLLNRAKALS